MQATPTQIIEMNVVKKKILIVEDGTAFGGLLSTTLSDAGYEVIGPAETAETAVALLSSCTPDAALLDVTLEHGTSFTVAQRLISLEVPIALVTAREPDELPDYLRDVPLLRKPFGSDGLLTTIDALLWPYQPALVSLWPSPR